MLLAAVLVAHPARAESPTSGMPAAALGQKISLDLKGVDILDVLKLLSQKSGLNFVAGRNVTGRVTIFAKDVGIWEAFERIMEANDLAYERKGELVNVMTAQEYEQLYGERFPGRRESRIITLRYAKSAQLATVLNQIKSSIGRVVVDEASNTVVLDDVRPRLEQMEQLAAELDRPTATRIYNLDYALAEELKDKLQDYLTPGMGSLQFDLRTNKAMVTDLEEKLGKIDQIMRELDEPEQQVLIEARIIRVQLNDRQALGIDWQQLAAGADIATRGNFRVLSDIVGGTATGVALRYATAPRENTRVVLEALNSFGKVTTASNPRITVSNNEEAKILVGTKEAFVTTTTTSTSTSGGTINAPQVQFVDVGTKLFVTPSIKRDGHIQLRIKPEVSTVSDTIDDIPGTRIPIISTTEAETTVLVRSGSTLIIGGLIDTRSETSHNQVPGLGNLPVVGAAFRSHDVTERRSELVVFLTPEIVDGDGQPVRNFPLGPPVVRVDDSGPLSDELVPSAYQIRVREVLARQLSRRLSALSMPEGSMVVTFTLTRNGVLLGAPEIASDNSESFIQAATAAVEQTAPFPPFPAESKADRVKFRIAVDYRPEG